MSMKSVLELELTVDEAVARVVDQIRHDSKFGWSSNFSYHAR